MTTSTQNPVATPEIVSQNAIDFYRANGFVHIPNIITRDEAERFRLAALDIAANTPYNNSGDVFTQLVNVWRDSSIMRELTLHANVAAAARRLSGVDLRLWHDQILIKKPHNKVATEFHQDQPYWPHENSLNPISCWIALCDVPVERGCMTFLPKSFLRTELQMQFLSDKNSLFSICPDFVWSPRITVPLRAGDCTFHHGRCAHMATPNETDEPRVAHVVIFMDKGVRYAGRGHVVTDPLKLNVGDPIDGELFPVV